MSYCSRCTKVIVAVTNDVIGHAKANGNLTDRVNKKYICGAPLKVDIKLRNKKKGVQDEKKEAIYTGFQNWCN